MFSEILLHCKFKTNISIIGELILKWFSISWHDIRMDWLFDDLYSIRLPLGEVILVEEGCSDVMSTWGGVPCAFPYGPEGWYTWTAFGRLVSLGYIPLLFTSFCQMEWMQRLGPPSGSQLMRKLMGLEQNRTIMSFGSIQNVTVAEKLCINHGEPVSGYRSASKVWIFPTLLLERSSFHPTYLIFYC